MLKARRETSRLASVGVRGSTKQNGLLLIEPMLDPKLLRKPLPEFLLLGPVTFLGLFFRPRAIEALASGYTPGTRFRTMTFGHLLPPLLD